MRILLGKVALASALVMLMAALVVPAQAAEVKNAYFSLELPDGWIQPQPAQEVNGSAVVVVANQKSGTAVSISVMAAPMSAKDIATQTMANMKTGGMQVEEPRERDGLYEAAFSKGAAKGMSWFGANGKACAVTTVIGKSVDDAKVLLKGLKPVDASLFPKF